MGALLVAGSFDRTGWPAGRFAAVAAVLLGWLLVCVPWLIWLKGKRKRLCCTLALLLACSCGLLDMWHAKSRMQELEAPLLEEQPVQVEGTVAGKQEKSNQETQSQWTVLLKNCHLKTSEGIWPGGTILLSIQIPTNNQPILGNVVLVRGKIRLFQAARNDGNFDERSYYQNQGITCRVYGDSWQIVDRDADSFGEGCYALRRRLRAVYEECMPKKEAGVLSAMLLGDKGLLSGELKGLYRKSGISHILAISGLHISIFGASTFRLLRRLGCGFGASGLVAFVFLLLFGTMAGMGVSTARSVIMFGIYLGAQWAGRKYDRINAMALAALAILAVHPMLLFQSGFQLSFGAVAGVELGQAFCRVMRPRLRLMESVLVSLGIQVVTLPILLWNYYELPVYSLLLNLFVLPCMQLVLLGGLWGGAFGLLATGPSMPLLGLVRCLLWLFEQAGSFSLRLPGAVFTRGCPKGWQMIAYYSVVILLVLALGWLEGRYKIRMLAPAADWKEEQRNKTKRQRTVLLATLPMAFCILLLRIPTGPMVAVLDVGQGDGIYLSTPEGLDLFIDGGSTNISNVGKYRLLPFLQYHGVGCIDYWFLSHLDKDHVSGMEELIEEGFPVRTVVLAEGIVRDSAYERLVKLLEQQGISLVLLPSDQSVGNGSSRLTCLLPGEETDPAGKDRNARSMVLLYEMGSFRGLFTGDISAQEEQELCSDQRIQGLTFYKAAHHGSNYSNSTELMEWAKPVATAVSCAKKNDYGHPGGEAVSRMEEHSGAVYYTMDSGQVSLVWDRTGRMRIKRKLR